MLEEKYGSVKVWRNWFSAGDLGPLSYIFSLLAFARHFVQMLSIDALEPFL